MAEIEGILARHSQSPYVRGQQNFSWPEIESNMAAKHAHFGSK